MYVMGWSVPELQAASPYMRQCCWDFARMMRAGPAQAPPGSVEAGPGDRPGVIRVKR